MFFELENIKIEIIRKRVKRMRLTIKPDKSVTLVLPEWASISEGEAFARRHIPWLKKHLKMMNAAPPKKEKTFDEGSEIYIFGKPYTIRLNVQKRAITKLYGDFLILAITKDDLVSREKAVQKFYSDELKKYALDRIKYYVSLYGFTVNGLKMRKMTSRWGSCNVKTKIVTLNTSLCEKPVEQIDYVIMHELIHTVVPNHGKDFYSYFDRLLPNHRQLKKALNGR